MKIYNSIILFILAAPFIIAQVAIGKNTVDGSALLDFAENTQMGIILPWVLDDSQLENGSLYYHVASKKVMIYNATQTLDLSIKPGQVDTTEIDNLQEIGSGIIIGNPNSTKKGVLVLDDNTKALVLPKGVRPWENIKNPEAGTMVYDTENNLICVYNGLLWTFWGH